MYIVCDNHQFYPLHFLQRGVHYTAVLLHLLQCPCINVLSRIFTDHGVMQLRHTVRDISSSF